MMDIVFDFTSSPVGGGLRRIDAYAEYFSASALKTLFLVHPKVAEKIAGYKGIRIEAVTRTGFEKVSGNAGYLRIAGRSARPRWLFSYGIPIHEKIADKHWFHVSNVLPFYLDRVTLDFKLRAKMTAFLWWVRRRSGYCDVVSAESLFSIGRYDAMTRTSGQRILLNNGMPEMFLTEIDGNGSSSGSCGNYAVAVGTASYKRIDRTYEAFIGLKKELGLERLKIIGNINQIPGVVHKADDVDVLSFLNDIEYFDLLSHSRVFISTSETENSSCAVIEGLFLSGSAVLSDIPSHLEMLAPELIQKRVVGSQQLVLAERSSINSNNVPTWQDSIEKMLKEMRL